MRRIELTGGSRPVGSVKASFVSVEFAPCDMEQPFFWSANLRPQAASFPAQRMRAAVARLDLAPVQWVVCWSVESSLLVSLHAAVGADAHEFSTSFSTSSPVLHRMC